MLAVRVPACSQAAEPCSATWAPRLRPRRSSSPCRLLCAGSPAAVRPQTGHWPARALWSRCRAWNRDPGSPAPAEIDSDKSQFAGVARAFVLEPALVGTGQHLGEPNRRRRISVGDPAQHPMEAAGEQTALEVHIDRLGLARRAAEDASRETPGPRPCRE